MFVPAWLLTDRSHQYVLPRNVAGAVRIFKNRNMSHIHAKHICVSTSGLVPHMPKVAR